MEEENFGYSLPADESLKISKPKRDTFISMVSVIALYYAADKSYDLFSEPWNNPIYSGLLLLDMLAAAACLHSGYQWRKASKEASELERRISNNE